WLSFLNSAERLAPENGGNLTRVLKRLQAPTLPNPNAELLDQFGFRFCGRRVTGLSEYFYETPVFELQLQLEVLRAIAPDTKTIIELGSGYSKNLFHLWLNGAPLDAEYIGAEYTDGGRRCGEFLASIEPGIRYRALPFDFYHPSLAGLGSSGKTFAFTCY